jgi:hypothetical protein
VQAITFGVSVRTASDMLSRSAIRMPQEHGRSLSSQQRRQLAALWIAERQLVDWLG